MRGFGFQSLFIFYFDGAMEQRKPMRKMKMKIIDVSSIQHHNECRAAGTRGDVTGTEDAILPSDYARYHGILN